MTLTPGQLAALREIQAFWPESTAVIIGATALGFYIDMRWRYTADVDLVVAIDIGDLQRLAARPGWQQDATKEHAFRTPDGTHVDILPASAALLAAGSITWPSGHVMSLAGMDLAFVHSEEHHLANGAIVRVAPPAVVTVLEMVAYLDRPPERERDLADIAHLLDGYVDDDADRRWDDASGIVFDFAPAYLLGLDIGRTTEARHRALIDDFLERVADPARTAHAIMERHGPYRWRPQEQPLTRRFAAFRQELDAARRCGGSG